MKELLAKLLDDEEDMADLHLSAKAAEADARTSALHRMSMDASRPVTVDGAAASRLRICYVCALRLCTTA